LVRGLGRAQLRSHADERQRGVAERAIGVRTGGGLAIRGIPRGRLGAILGLERVVEGEPEVSGVDSGVGALQRVRGRGKIFFRVPLGTGGASGVGRGLGLLDFFVWGIAAAGSDRTRRDDDRAYKTPT